MQRSEPPRHGRPESHNVLRCDIARRKETGQMANGNRNRHRAWDGAGATRPMRLILGFALALAFGSAAPALAQAAAPLAQSGGFDVPKGEAIPGFEQAQTGAAPENSAAAAPKPSDVAPKPSNVALKPSDVAGRYAILRAGGKDSGCMLTLDDKSKAKRGYRANLSPACRDQGMVIFDPAGWQLVKGRLILIAQKGHKAELDLQADGTWQKDPKDGKKLILKKM